MVADELRRQADSFLELQDLAPRIARDPAARDSSHQRPHPNDDEADAAKPGGEMLHTA
jgi:hypothetical protein